MDRDSYMNEAVAEAFEGIRAGHGGPFGCVIVKDDEVVARGHNRVLADHDPTAHGEMVALRRAGKALGTHDLSGCTLYTSSEPCPMCAAAIAWANVDRVYYGCTAREAGDLLGFRDDAFYASLRAGEPLTPSERLAPEGALGPFEEYAATAGTIY